jgi:hypothetical protein
MRRILTTVEIETTCVDLLETTREVGVRTVMNELRKRYGGCGRTARVSGILRATAERLHKDWQRASRGNGGQRDRDLEDMQGLVASLRYELKLMTQRAIKAEARERAHQDFWANRYAERVAELERRQEELAKSRPGVTAEQYLRVYQRTAELWRRLAEYEPTVEPLFPPATTK